MNEAAIQRSQTFIIDQVGAVPLRDIAKLVKTANQYSAEVAVGCGGSRADGKSFFEVGELPLSGRRLVTLSALGADAEPCLTALAQVVGSWSKRQEIDFACDFAGT